MQLHDRVTLIADKACQRQIWRNAGNPGVVIANGRAAGVWRSQKKGRRLNVEVELFEALSPGMRSEIEAEVAGLAPFKNCDQLIPFFLCLSIKVLKIQCNKSPRFSILLM